MTRERMTNRAAGEAIRPNVQSEAGRLSKAAWALRHNILFRIGGNPGIPQDIIYLVCHHGLDQGKKSRPVQNGFAASQNL
jgi:hypothetical protein